MSSSSSLNQSHLILLVPVDWVPANRALKEIISSVFLVRKVKSREANHSSRAVQLGLGQARLQALCSTFPCFCNYLHGCGFYQHRLMSLRIILQTTCVVNGLVIAHWCDLGLFLCAADHARRCAHCLKYVSSPVGQIDSSLCCFPQLLKSCLLA